ncbi:hypothetical protein M2480_002298 [Parabacteroides sp. PFB2-12]|uniref:hypothetical protein n=1 Tax=unclassified Parabacteroides TaxID=2649774 RepID=UPI002474103E|nr:MULTISPECIES: hypothetical protein [unclassified Parabacteroides]MDH6343667.1 hypothetical protein [Parabacteroides sp. PM6-13]MDH6391303.1 hypothetical protein [Parabacteroides sp. PFB2-12]
MANKLYPFFLFCLLLFCSSCEDDKQEVITNAAGSQIEVVGNMKVSSFKIPNKQLTIERLMKLKHRLQSLRDGRKFNFNGSIKEIKPDEIICELHIPIDNVIPDGDYNLAFTAADNSITIPTQFVLTFKDEMVAAILQNTTNYSAYFSGDGTAESPYLVNDIDKFLTLLSADRTNAKGLFFRQTEDLIMPVQAIRSNFSGSYDGGGFKLKNLTFDGANNDVKENSYVGFFRELNDGSSVSNIVFSDVMIINAENNVGVVAGSSYGSVSLKNISVSGKVQGNLSVGGLIGSTTTGNLLVEDINLGIIVKGNDFGVGGLFGLCLSNVTITSVRNTKGFSVSGGDNVGGLIGDFSGIFDIKNVSLQVATVDDGSFALWGTAYCLGGIIGRASLRGHSTISGSTIQLPIHGVDRVGAFLGNLSLDEYESGYGITLKDNRVLPSQISGVSDVGGFVGYWANVRVNELSNLLQQASVTGMTNVGGFVGQLYAANWVSGKVNGVKIEPSEPITAKKKVAGGVFGEVLKSKNEIDISPASFTIGKNVSVNAAYTVGGIVGRAENTTFTGDVSFIVDEDQAIKNLKGSSSFSGKINNLEAYRTTTYTSGGLFGEVEDCTIKNVMADAEVRGERLIGGIAGNAINSFLTYCVTKGGSVEAQSFAAGGICGKMLMTKAEGINYLVNNASVSCSNKEGDSSGGIIGYFESGKGTISDFINVGNVTGFGSVGGVIGSFISKDKGSKNDNIVTLKRAVNYGEVSGSYRDGEEMFGLGGVVGTARYCAEIRESANHGPVTALQYSTYNGVGGVAGVLGGKEQNQSHIKLISCCNTATITNHGDKSKSRYTMGGVAGRLFNGDKDGERTVNMHNCYNKGAVNESNNRDNGGILGSIQSYAAVHECINIGKVQHGNGGVGSHPNDDLFFYINYMYYLKGSGKSWKGKEFSDSQKQKEGTFENFSFGRYWLIDKENKNGGFPYLVDCYYQFAKKPVL